MTAIPEINVVNMDRAKYTGLNGWMHESGKVILCARVGHFGLLCSGALDGIAEDEAIEDRRGGWQEIRKWAAGRGWMHFIEARDAIADCKGVLHVVVHPEREVQRKLAERFARDMGLALHIVQKGEW